MEEKTILACRLLVVFFLLGNKPFAEERTSLLFSLIEGFLKTTEEL